MKNKVYNAFLALFVMTFVASGAVIGYKLFSKSKVENQIEELKEVFQELPGQAQVMTEVVGDGKDTLPRAETLEEQLENRKSRLDGYVKLRNQNGDMMGWLTIPGTRIDYPVMQSKDRPDYYLKRDFNGQKSSHGTPYIAESCDLESGDDNIIIYGHHMKDGTMFADLMKYADKSYYTDHTFLWFDTLDMVSAYEIIAVTKASASAADDEMMFGLAADNTKRQEFLDVVSKRSFYDIGQISDNGKPLLVLITCEYTQNEGRLLVVAREVIGNK